MQSKKNNKMYNKFFFIIILILLTFSGLSQGTKSLRINISNYNDTILILTSYYGDKIRIVDTAYSQKGKFEFKSDSTFSGGIYMAVSIRKTKLFEFILNNEARPTLSTDSSSFVHNMTTKGSKENKIFFNYVKYNESTYKKTREYYTELKNTNVNNENYEKLVAKIDSLNQVSINYKLRVIETNPDLFVSKLLNSMRDVEFPDSITSKNDSSIIFRYYKKHYWDNIDLSDSRFLRTPVFDKKINEYFDQLVVFQPDSIIKGIDIVLKKTQESKENFSFLLWKFISEYQNPKFMGFDKVFVHLAETYFKNNSYQIENANASVRKSIIDRAEKIKPLMLGSKAPNLILIDTSGNYVSFDRMTEKYLALLFWDFDCGICKKEIKYLKENMPNWKYDIGIFAINTNGELDEWKKYIIDNKLNWMNVNGTRSVTNDFHDVYDIYGTPVIYLLDEKRNIVAKRMGAEQIPEIIDMFEKLKD